MDELFALYEAGKIRPQISDHLPLTNAAEALRRIENREAQGKNVLTVDKRPS
jgi:NADPH2:quinone reductase